MLSFHIHVHSCGILRSGWILVRTQQQLSAQVAGWFGDLKGTKWLHRGHRAIWKWPQAEAVVGPFWKDWGDGEGRTEPSCVWCGLFCRSSEEWLSLHSWWLGMSCSLVLETAGESSQVILEKTNAFSCGLGRKKVWEMTLGQWWDERKTWEGEGLSEAELSRDVCWGGCSWWSLANGTGSTCWHHCYSFGTGWWGRWSVLRLGCRDMTLGQTSETKAEDPLVDQQMRTASSGGSVYGTWMEEIPSTVSTLNQFSGWLHGRGESTNVELCPQILLAFYLWQYWKISIHSYPSLSLFFFFFLWINIDYEG